MAKQISQKLVYDKKLTNKHMPKEYQIVLNIVGANKEVLEVGCHTGYFTELLKKNGCNVICVEINQEAAMIAKKIANKIIIGDIEDESIYNQINQKFDVILFMHVLEHLINPWKVLCDIKQFLKEDGYILVTIPNIACWSIRKVLFFKGKFEYTETGIMDKSHLRFFTFETAKKMFIEAGYKIEKWDILESSILLSRIRYIPLIKYFMPYWERFLLKNFPNLSGAVFLFILTPSE